MKNLLLLFLGFSLWACQKSNTMPTNSEELILETLQMETQFFCERNVKDWEKQWLHSAIAYKMYANPKHFEAYEGWEAIRQFTVDHVSKNPNPIPLPNNQADYDIHLFTETAWVFFSKIVDGAQVRESRFMVKEDDKWKIARMETIFL